MKGLAKMLALADNHQEEMLFSSDKKSGCPIRQPHPVSSTPRTANLVPRTCP
jgi:hypothetical protein